MNEDEKIKTKIMLIIMKYMHKLNINEARLLTNEILLVVKELINKYKTKC